MLNECFKTCQSKPCRVSDGTTRGSHPFEIADNGVGFDEKKRESTFGHYGIIGMSERVRLLGGEIHLKSKKNEGTQVIVNIPLKKE
ncbi:ATP-binding protein [Bacillus safensis]|uniref:ATP-binding protein n=1 Tax=Bacillus safensis TaxID=561879 RepID=UPI00345E1C7F